MKKFIVRKFDVFSVQSWREVPSCRARRHLSGKKRIQFSTQPNSQTVFLSRKYLFSQTAEQKNRNFQVLLASCEIKI